MSRKIDSYFAGAMGIRDNRAESRLWKFSQCNLTIPVPNQLAGEFVAAIRALLNAAER